MRLVDAIALQHVIFEFEFAGCRAVVIGLAVVSVNGRSSPEEHGVFCGKAMLFVARTLCLTLFRAFTCMFRTISVDGFCAQ